MLIQLAYHHPLAGTKLYCMVTEAHVCEQLAQRQLLTVYMCIIFYLQYFM